MTHLTDEDQAAMLQAIWDAERDGDERERIYLAGKRAGLEQAAKACVSQRKEGEPLHTSIYELAVKDCTAAILALDAAPQTDAKDKT